VKEPGEALLTTRWAEVAVEAVLLALAVLLAFDNWHTGMSWDATGPQAGYFPFYLSVLLGGASVYGIARQLLPQRPPDASFVTREQLWRVTQVFVPTLAFCVLMQWLGLYVASFLLVAGFMKVIGRIAAWKALLAALVFSLGMFATFEIGFDVLMPKGPLEALFGR
jgi:hypothetical protein